ncbi:NAD(P)H-binding protein [Kribbella sp. NPDC048915]|uniref:NAD(P)H-binding protein n=1 Tax=Kribbella sp. NPDC048915 TaxID=3155148 RepID=UPI0033D220F3
MIIVTGATGRLGRAVVERLAERAPAEQLGVSVRDPEKAADLAARGIRVRRGDFGDPVALAHALEGAAQVLLVSGPADPEPHRVAIDVAKAAGAKRIVYTSHQAASPDSLFVATRGHAASEQDLAESGVPFTSLRNGFYASTTVYLLRSALETGELILPEDGPVSWTAHQDLTEAATIALIDPNRLAGLTPTDPNRLAGLTPTDPNRLAGLTPTGPERLAGLTPTDPNRLAGLTPTDPNRLAGLTPTGPERLAGVTPALTGQELFDYADVAALVTDLTGRKVTRVTVPDEEWRQTAIAHGMPEFAADLTLGIFAAARRGEFAVVDPTLPTLLDRPTTTLRDVLTQELTL